MKNDYLNKKIDSVAIVSKPADYPLADFSVRISLINLHKAEIDIFDAENHKNGTKALCKLNKMIGQNQLDHLKLYIALDYLNQNQSKNFDNEILYGKTGKVVLSSFPPSELN